MLESGLDELTRMPAFGDVFDNFPVCLCLNGDLLNLHAFEGFNHVALKRMRMAFAHTHRQNSNVLGK